MKLLYIANARIPTEKAHGIHIIKMCEALAAQNVEVTLVLPQRENAIKEDPFVYYGIKRIFSIKYLPIVDLIGKGFLGYWFTQIYFSWQLLRMKFSDKEYIVITRDELSGWLMRQRRFKVYYDMHGFPETWLWLWKIAVRSMSGVICTNEWKIQQIQRLFGIKSNKILLARNGFDADAFKISQTKQEVREKIGLPIDVPVVMYVGHLYDWKGVDVLARSAIYLKQVKIVFIGGTSQDLKEFRERYKINENILVLGHIHYATVPLCLKAADVLVLPNSRKSNNPRAIPYSIHDTSPIKLFEYMASNKPIVASDLPSIREILNDEAAIFFEPDNPQALAKSVTYFLEHQQEAEKYADYAWKSVQKYSWKKRAQHIISFVNSF